MFRRTRRLIKILYTLAYYRIDQLILPKPLCLSYLLFWQSNPFKDADRGKRIYLACCHLGPFWIKLGQLISIRHDLFPTDITNELTNLQDNVPAADPGYVTNYLTQHLGQPPEQIFEQFDTQAVGSASIAQVHKAKLKTGQTVAVKILKPNILAILNLDIALLRGLTVLTRYAATAKGLIDEYEHSLHQETNLRQEASHYTQMQHNFASDNRLHVPKVYWSHTNDHVLTLEYIDAVNIADIHKHPHVDLKALAYHGVQIFFTQVFKHRFFHADMHPGNIFVDITYPRQPKYIAIDFGIIGILSPEDQYYLAESFLAFYKRDYTRIAQLHIDAGWVSSSTNLIQFENAIRGVCEPIFSLPIEQISIAQIMQQVVKASKRFELNIQPQLLMLQKTLFHVEAVGRELYPKLNLWDAAKPFISDFMQQRASLKSGWHTLKDEMPRIIQHAPQLPSLIHQRLRQPPQPQQNFVYQTIASVILGVLIAAPQKLTKPATLYIISNIIIIMVTWHTLKSKNS